MDKYYHQGQGDLADILRPSTAPRRPPIQDPPADQLEGPGEESRCYHHLGDDPFSNMMDPLLLHELELAIPRDSSFLGGFIPDDSLVNHGGDLGCSSGTSYPMSALYATPTSSLYPQQGPSSSVIAMACHMEGMNPNSRCRPTDTAAAMQISSRNPGTKRRKGLSKKVVCIPAPASMANGRAGGEVVPLDLWAWRKYGQKPIKGSPYPRGYYRCSSSKGCSARKQVERSRTDPNMLVVTYMSEHNHPWPTQRNALAGSNRATQSSNNNNGRSNLAPKASYSSSPQRDKRLIDTVPTTEAVPGGRGSLVAYVKEEIEGANDERSEEDRIKGQERGRFDDEDDFLFRDLEGMDGGSDPLSFLLNQGEPDDNSRPEGGSD